MLTLTLLLLLMLLLLLHMLRLAAHAHTAVHACCLTRRTGDTLSLVEGTGQIAGSTLLAIGSIMSIYGAYVTCNRVGGCGVVVDDGECLSCLLAIRFDSRARCWCEA